MTDNNESVVEIFDEENEESMFFVFYNRIMDLTIIKRKFKSATELTYTKNNKRICVNPLDLDENKFQIILDVST